MTRAAEFRAHAEEMLRQAQAAELPAVRDRYLQSARVSLGIATRLERSAPREAPSAPPRIETPSPAAAL